MLALLSGLDEGFEFCEVLGILFFGGSSDWLNQTNHLTLISTLQAMVLGLQATTPPTPPSQQRFRKKANQRPQN
jgi:hypothetical protein